MRAVSAVLITALIAPLARAADAAPQTEKPHIDIVFCIDCSGSMRPVIETAKQKVWAIVNEIAKARPSPVLRIGLLGYGNALQPLRFTQLTDDLDAVYKDLLVYTDDAALGQEFVGHAIHRATTEMHWSDGKQTLKVIYVVGNETAHQGPPELDYTRTAPAAIARGIIVNAIYCGNYDYATAPPTWREFARLADGQYMEIAETGGAITISTPFDQRLSDLSQKLNTTYVAYGPAGAAASVNQAAQDANATRLGTEVAAARALSKSTTLYRNSTWDLIDASREEKEFDLAKLKDEQLPPEMRPMTSDQRKAYLESKSRERDQIQAEIKQLANQRDAYVKQQTRKQGLTSDKAFDENVRRSILEQAKQKGFQFSD